MNPFEIYNVFFYLSLTIGILMLIGSSFGLLEFDGIDGEFDGGGIEADADFGDIKGSVLDVGRVPFTMVVLISTLVFGVSGLIINMFLLSFLPGLALYVFMPVSIGGSLFFSFMTTKRLAKTIIKIMPTMESYSVSKDSYIGSSGMLTVETDEKYGIAIIDVMDSKGNANPTRVQCCIENGAHSAGTHIVVTSYDQDNDICIVSPLL